MPEFFGPLSRSAFLVNKENLFLQKCIELLTVFRLLIYIPPLPTFLQTFFVSLLLNRKTINNSMSGNFYTSSAGRCGISDTVSQMPAAATQCLNIQVPTILQQEGSRLGVVLPSLAARLLCGMRAWTVPFPVLCTWCLSPVCTLNPYYHHPNMHK